MSTSPDLCVVGAGALGIDLALYARRLGLSVVLADRDLREPGDAAEKAIRMAALSESARRAQDMRSAPDLGLGASEFKLSARQIAERADALVVAARRASSPEILSARGVTVMQGAVRFSDTQSLLIGDIALKPRRIILALGGAPIVPELPGLADVAFFTPDSILENQRKLTHLVIIGSDVASFEQAQLQRRLGAAVTLIPHGPVLPEFDPEAVDLLLSALGAEGINIRGDMRLVSVTARSQGIGIEIEGEGGSRESLDASHILVSVGRSVNFDQLDIANARLKAGGNVAAPFLRGPLGMTSSRSIRLAGTAAGEDAWGAAQAQGRAIVEVMAGRRARAIAVPRVIQTEPALAQIAAPAPAGRSAHRGEIVLRENFGENTRALAMSSPRGLVKVKADGQGRILSAVVLGPQAPEIAGLLSLAMGQNRALADLASLPLPRPSLFEVLTRLGENYAGSHTVPSPMQRGRLLRRFWRR